MKVYIASSWKNSNQPAVVARLRSEGHEVYDCRHPNQGESGFGWKTVDPVWTKWSAEKFLSLLNHPLARRGFGLNFRAMQWADACVLILPCGRSSHIEAGWFIGAGKPTIIMLGDEPNEPELMYKLATKIVVSIEEVVEQLKALRGNSTRDFERALCMAGDSARRLLAIADNHWGRASSEADANDSDADELFIFFGRKYDPNVCPDGECSLCAILMCPHYDADHLHHDGCPSCHTKHVRTGQCGPSCASNAVDAVPPSTAVLARAEGIGDEPK